METDYDIMDLRKYGGDVDLVDDSRLGIEKKDDSVLADLAWS